MIIKVKAVDWLLQAWYNKHCPSQCSSWYYSDEKSCKIDSKLPGRGMGYFSPQKSGVGEALVNPFEIECIFKLRIQ